MRKNRPEYKNTKKNRDSFQNRCQPENLPVREKGKGGNVDSTCCQVSQPYWKTTQKIQQSETERNEVSDPLEHKVSITQDIPLSRERTERD